MRIFFPSLAKTHAMRYNYDMNQSSNVKLFHGSKSGINGKIMPISRELCDFGKGFYMGTEETQPKTLICNYQSATMYGLELDTRSLVIKDIPLNLDWAMFVAFNRGRLTKDLSSKLDKSHVTFALYEPKKPCIIDD